MVEDPDDIADDESVPTTEHKTDTGSKSSNPSFYEQESGRFWSSVRSGSGGAGPQLLGVGVVVLVIVIVLRRRKASGETLHEKSLA